ncbi:MAG: 50S ribosomal protein L4 [Nitrospirae bacterium RBG_16_64_22]|nr:MAG: 50S ribosomal protein L4 [Nitrospirae bacterium RBG_16_64_22]
MGKGSSVAVAKIVDQKGKEKGSLDLPEALFGVAPKSAVMHGVVTAALSNRRQGTHATKTKGLVSGGGKKPWKQKGTGRARAGSIRSPLWVGGGTVFGPQPRSYRSATPKKVGRLALKMALSARAHDDGLRIVDSLGVQGAKTREVAAILRALGLEGKTVLLVTAANDPLLFRAARNIPGVQIREASSINAHDVLGSEVLLMTPESVERLRQVFGS